MTSKPPLTLPDLTVALDQIFATVDGPARAFFVIPYDGGRLQIRYQTVALAVPGDDESAEAQACLAFYNALKSMLPVEVQEDRDTILFWRRRPSFRMFLNAEGRPFTALTARLAVPGFTLPAEIVKEEGTPLG
jgi:hypothetical protein